MQNLLPLLEDWGIDLMDNLKLKWKVFGFLVSFCALLLVVLWLFQTVFLNDMYKYIRTEELERAIVYVEKNINTKDFRTIMQELKHERDIMVTNSNEFSSPSIYENRKGRPIPEAITKTKEFTLNDGTTVSITFYAIISPVNATVTTLRYQLYFITGIMILLASLIAIIMAKLISKPIEKINQSAKIFGTGNYNIHFDGHGFLEVKELSNTLNNAAKELSKIENFRRELMANISHDLRTPLTLIYGYAEMMNDFPDEINSQQTQTIMSETARLSSLVNDVLEISKLESGVEKLNITNFNLTQVIKSTCDMLSELMKKDGYNICFDYENEIFVNADEIKITQVFYNLLINAINYSAEDKNIIISQTVKGGYVRISVIDKGEGIEPENLPLIWDRYYKTGKSHKRAVTGTGIGLSIVKKIIKLHGGKHGVFSEPKKGSTFWFEIKML
jgi:signal transduction histidine kinase